MAFYQDQQLQSFVQVAGLALLAESLEDEEDKENKKRLWVRNWIGRRPREVPLFREVGEEDREKFFSDFRMYPIDFEKLLQRLDGRISKQDTNLREAIPARLRLQVTLRYLSGPASFSVLEDIFRIPKSTLSRLIPEVCQALWDELNEECIVLPQTNEDWLEKSEEFKSMWQYPYALAALDGKHVKVQAFKKSGSLFYNYKGHFSIILFALVDAKYKFLFTEIGRPGSVNDAKVWQESTLKQALDSGALNLPPPNGVISHHFVGDEIFPLSTTLMKPFSRVAQMGVREKIFNYRFSRARRVVENAFGILSSRFRVLRTTILQNYENAIKTVKACVVLHNYLIQNCNADGSYYNPSSVQREDENGDLLEGFWEQDGARVNIQNLSRLAGNRSGTIAARDQRNLLAENFITDNLAPWQFHCALRSS